MALSIEHSPVYCLAHSNDGDLPYYVVIGAFSVHSNAVRFTSHAHQDFKLDAKYELNPDRNLYYVYVLNTTDLVQAISEVRRLRTRPEFTDAWVYYGILGHAASAIEDQSPSQGVDIDPVTQIQKKNVLPRDTSGKYMEDTSVDTAEKIMPQPAEKTSAANETGAGIKGKDFFFKIYNATDRKSVTGDVDIIDAKNARKINTYKGNMPVRLPPPQNNSDSIALVCEVFGYRKAQRNINYNHPEGKDISVEDGAVVVPFELVRLQKGDIAVMYNVYFFKDAAMMRPESRYEINSLLEMLNENPNYKIKIHGHTNGDAYGRIISMDKDSEHFFSLHSTQDGYGSAKKLSEERAQTIRNYLVTNGINPQRTQIKAWGGKRPLQHKHSIRAQENVRVEIEILEE